MTTELAVNVPVERLVAIYQAAEADIRAAFGQVDRALRSLGATFEDEGRKPTLQGRWGRRHDCEWEDPEPTIKELRRSVWGDLIERLQLRRVMSCRAWEEFEKQIEQGEPPPITVETVTGMVAHFRAEAPAMLEAAVKEVFEWLRPRGWLSEYKTNTELEIGERVILSCLDVTPYRLGCWGVSQYSQQHMMGLENVFRMLDGGKLRDPAGRYYSDLESAISTIRREDTCAGETEYFAFRGHKNGNLHLRFRRMDLVAKLNAVAGGMRLKPQQQKVQHDHGAADARTPGKGRGEDAGNGAGQRLPHRRHRPRVRGARPRR